MQSETRRRLPPTTLSRKVENMILKVAESSPNNVPQWPAVSLGSVYCARAIIAVKTKNGMSPASMMAANSM